MKTHPISELLEEQTFFLGMTDEQLDFIAGCATNVRFEEGQYLALLGKVSDHFYIFRTGRAALEVDAGNRTYSIKTVSAGDIIGWSWVTPPYEWHYDVRALELIHAVAFDAECVREKCESDPVFGYEMYKRFIKIVVERLLATRIQLTDLYA